MNYKAADRPIIKLPLTGYEKILEILSGLGVLFCVIITVAAWRIIPAEIPTHFGGTGTPDSWGGKESLVLLPVGSIILYALLTVINKYPHTFNYPWRITEENAKRQYLNARYLLALLKTEIILVFAYIQLMTILVALGKARGLGSLFLPVFLVIIFGTIGVYFYKARRDR